MTAFDALRTDIKAREDGHPALHNNIHALLKILDGRATGIVNAAEDGAVGGGTADETHALQSALDRGAGGVVVVPPGVHLVDASVGIQPRDNTHLVLAPGALLAATPNDLDHSRLICLQDAENVTISGGQVRGERDAHIGDQGQDGHCIEINGGQNIVLRDLCITDAWGDGVFITHGETIYQPTNVRLSGLTVHNCRRNGIGVATGTNVIISETTVTKTTGHSPETGINIEPYLENHKIRDLQITSCFLSGNRNGLYIPGDISRDIERVMVCGVRATGNGEVGFKVLGAHHTVLSDCQAFENQLYGFVVHNADRCSLMACISKLNNTVEGPYYDVIVHTATGTRIIASQIGTYHQHEADDTRMEATIIG